MSATHAPYLACIALVGIINTLPVAGVLGAPQLAAAYGIAPPSDSLLLLLRHRAILFGIIGAFVLLSLVKADLRVPALAMAGASMLAFLLLAVAGGETSEALRRVVAADIAGLLALAVAALLHWSR